MHLKLKISHTGLSRNEVPSEAECKAHSTGNLAERRAPKHSQAGLQSLRTVIQVVYILGSSSARFTCLINKSVMLRAYTTDELGLVKGAACCSSGVDIRNTS